MSEFYDDSKVKAPQYGVDSRLDLLSHQSAVNDFVKALADRVWRHPRLGAAIVLAIVGGYVKLG